MLLKHLGSDTGRLETVEIDYRVVGLRRLIRHLKRLPGLTVTKFRSWPLTDDYWLDFTFRGHRFELESPFVHYWISRQPDCPDDVFEALLDHLRSLPVSRFRYWFLYRFTDYDPSPIPNERSA